MSKLERVNGYVEKFAGKVSISDEGVGTIAEGALDAALPEGITQKSISEHDQAKADIASALAIVFGSESKAVFDKNKELKEASMSQRIGSETVVNINQKRTVEQLAKPGSSEKITRHGYVSVGMTQYASMKSGEVSKHERVTKAWGSVSD